jgi:hypothetical protein
MIWTMMIVGIKLFACIDEIIQMKMEDLPHEFFIVKDGNVEVLATKIKGKCDTKIHIMALWDDPIKVVPPKLPPTQATCFSTHCIFHAAGTYMQSCPQHV